MIGCPQTVLQCLVMMAPAWGLSVLRAPKGKIKKMSKSNLALKPSNIGPKSMLKMLTATEFHVDFDSGIKMGGCLAK